MLEGMIVLGPLRCMHPVQNVASAPDCLTVKRLHPLILNHASDPHLFENELSGLEDPPNQPSQFNNGILEYDSSKPFRSSNSKS